MAGATASSRGDLDTHGCFRRLAALPVGSSVVSLGEGTSGAALGVFAFPKAIVGALQWGGIGMRLVWTGVLLGTSLGRG